MQISAIGAAKRTLGLSLCLGLAGCALGALSSSIDGDDARNGTLSGMTADGEVHSKTCEGLAIERRTREDRIGQLEKAMQSELSAAPATISQVFKRMGSRPEEGTTSYLDVAAERERLRASEIAAMQLKCPSGSLAKLP